MSANVEFDTAQDLTGRVFLYVLLLDGNHFYVGMTRGLKRRLWQHFRSPAHWGSDWTAKYKPFSVIHCSEIFGKSHDLAFIENQATLRLAKLKGADRVRGGAYTREELGESWIDEVNKSKAADITRFVPISRTSLTNLLKGAYDDHKGLLNHSQRFAKERLKNPLRFILAPFSDNDEIKALGGRWHRDQKLWYIPRKAETSTFAKWPTFCLWPRTVEESP